MTGFRLGYLNGPRKVVSLLTKLQESMVACVNAPTQHAGIEALTGPQACVEQMVGEYKSRRDLAVGHAQQLGLEPYTPAGAFYLWLELPGLIDSQAFANELLTRYRVPVAPGSTFGEPDGAAIRISLAAGNDDITVGLDAIGNLMNKLPAT